MLVDFFVFVIISTHVMCLVLCCLKKKKTLFLFYFEIRVVMCPNIFVIGLNSCNVNFRKIRIIYKILKEAESMSQ